MADFEANTEALPEKLEQDADWSSATAMLHFERVMRGVPGCSVDGGVQWHDVASCHTTGDAVKAAGAALREAMQIFFRVDPSRAAPQRAGRDLEFSPDAELAVTTGDTG